MQKRVLVLLLCILTTGVQAAEDKRGYFELWAGTSDFEPKTTTYTGTLGDYTFTDARATLKYDHPMSYGLEVGLSRFLDTPLRVGIFFLTTKANLKETSGAGTVSDGVDTFDFGLRVTGAQLRGIGLDFDNTIDLYGVNAYYDFKTGSTLTPFVGFGIGRADIQNARKNEFAAALHLGLNYALTKASYLGARVSGYRINGPTDKLGIKYEDIKVTNYGLQLGFHY